MTKSHFLRPLSRPLCMERPLKRVAGVLDEGTLLTERREACEYNAPSTSNTTLFATMPNELNICAFGLEDRAEAVISRGKESWTLANLSKWRHKTFDKNFGGLDSLHTRVVSKEFLRQRQRAYRHQCLTSANRVYNNHLD